MTTRTTARATTQLPTAAECIKTFEASTELGTALLGVRGPASKIIPANIRTLMRSQARLSQYWSKNREAYNVLLAASQATAPAARTKGAGA